MTKEEIIERRKRLEEEIALAIYEFEADTDIDVEGFLFEANTARTEDGRFAERRITVKAYLKNPYE